MGLGTDYIVARGNTITGSIGVLAQWPEVSQLLDKVGVTFNEVKSGPLKASPNPVRTSDACCQASDARHHRRRLPLVPLAGRVSPGHFSSLVKGLTDGRIYSGRQALDFKLVDAIGGEPEAVKWLEDSREFPRISTW